MGVLSDLAGVGAFDSLTKGKKRGDSSSDAPGTYMAGAGMDTGDSSSGSTGSDILSGAVDYLKKRGKKRSNGKDRS